MATTTNYSWTTPDDTALVKDGAAAIRTLGSSIDTTTKNLNPSTTLGDIEYRSSTANTNTRLPIGTNNQVLLVSGGVPAWGAAPPGSANWSLLNTGGTALTGAATITISGISGADKILIGVAGGSSANALSNFSIRFNADSGNNYTSFGIRNLYQLSYTSTNFVTATSTATSSIPFGRMSNNVASTISGNLLMTGCNTSGLKVFQATAAGEGADGSADQNFVGGIYSGTSTISSISILSSTGNFDAGTIFVYTSA